MPFWLGRSMPIKEPALQNTRETLYRQIGNLGLNQPPKRGLIVDGKYVAFARARQFRAQPAHRVIRTPIRGPG